MEVEFGGPANWQKIMTEEWIRKMIQPGPGKIVFEGQINIQFIIDGFKKYNYDDYKIFLVDCSEKTMINRLTNERKQPELAHYDMKKWLRFLRKQATDLNINIINTDELSVNESGEIIITSFGN